MTDEKNNVQTGASPEYVGPPKSRAFQSSTAPQGMPKVAPSAPPMPKQISPDQQLDEQSILMDNSTFKGDGGDNELLRAIASEENVMKMPEKKKKEKQKKDFDLKDLKKFIDDLSTMHQQWKFFYKENERTFNILNIFWMIAKVLFYCAGLAFFALSSYFYFTFEDQIHAYLNKKGVDNITFEKIDYSLSGFILYNVKERDGLFSIDHIRAQYSFADLLEKKIPFVGIDTLKVRIEEGENAKNTTQKFAKTLYNLGLFDNSSLFSVKNLRLDNSVLYIGDKKYNLPVNFSGIGTLNHLTFPIVLKNEYVNLVASVDVDISSSSATWKLDVTNGSLTLPNLGSKDLRGTANFTTSRGTLVSASFSGQLKDDEETKDVTVNLSRNGQEAWSARIGLTIPQRNAPPTVYLLNLSNVLFGKDLKSFRTDAPISIKATNFQFSKFGADEIKLNLRGALTCNMDICTYFIREKSEMIMLTPVYSFYETDLFAAYSVLEIAPSKEPAMLLRKDGVQFNIYSAPSSLSLRKRSNIDTANQNVVVDLAHSHINASFNFKDKNTALELSSSFDRIDEPTFLLEKGDLHLKLSEQGLTTQMEARKARFKDFPYFKPEFSMKLTVLPDYYFSGILRSSRNNISVTMNGYYNPYNFGVLMAVQTTEPIVFGENRPLPHEISSLVSERITDVSGKVSLKGEIHYKGPRVISGPLKVKLDDLSFKYGNTEVKNMNTVLNISQLLPFGAQGVQNIYAESVTNILPFKNVNTQIFFDANRKQFNFSSLSADVAGYSLLIDPMWYSYTSPIYNFNFKGRLVPAQNILNGTTLNDVKIKGNAYVTLALQMEDANVALKTMEFSVPSEGTIYYTPKVYKAQELENLKQLDFRNLAVYLIGQGEENELIFSSENKSNKVKKKTNFRMKVKKPLSEFILPQKTVIPDFVAEEKGRF